MTGEQDIAIRMSGAPMRFQEIDAIEAWYWGKGYEVGPYARQFPWDKERDSEPNGRYIPLAKRKPYDLGIAKSLVDRSTGFLFDEERFPSVEVEGDEAAEAWLTEVFKVIAFRTEMLEGARIGGRARSVFAYFKIVDGEPILDMHNGKICTPTFKRDGKNLVSVRKQYKTDGAELRSMGYTQLDPDKQYWYRRDFTNQAEIGYVPVEVKAGADVPVFKEDPANSFVHNLGFLPGVWMTNLVKANGYDGVSTYECAINLIHRCNVLMSQADRAIGNACDPQYALEYDPEKGEIDADAITTQTKGGIWKMPGTVKLVEMAGNGQTVALAQFEQYLTLIGQQTGVPESDSGKMSDKAQSAEALRIMNQAIISFASILRVCYGEQGIVPLSKVILSVLKATTGETLSLQAVDPDGKAYDVSQIGDNPRVCLKWGPWFPPSALDRTNEVTSTSGAVMAGLLSQETGSSYVATLYDTEPAEEWERIQTEQAAKAAQMMDQQVALHAALNDTSEPTDGNPND